VTRTITYHGSAARAGALVQMLEQEGVRVVWSPPREERSLGADVNAVVVTLVSTGTIAGITAAVARFRKWAPRAKVELEGEQPDDGGFLASEQPRLRSPRWRSSWLVQEAVRIAGQLAPGAAAGGRLGAAGLAAGGLQRWCGEAVAADAAQADAGDQSHGSSSVLGLAST
jgi:hypothetical protein